MTTLIIWMNKILLCFWQYKYYIIHELDKINYGDSEKERYLNMSDPDISLSEYKLQGLTLL